jgi:hypothetical protein
MLSVVSGTIQYFCTYIYFVVYVDGYPSVSSVEKYAVSLSPTWREGYGNITTRLINIRSNYIVK